jgi:hypothetical protein
MRELFYSFLTSSDPLAKIAASVFVIIMTLILMKFLFWTIRPKSAAKATSEPNEPEIKACEIGYRLNDDFTLVSTGFCKEVASANKNKPKKNVDFSSLPEAEEEKWEIVGVPTPNRIISRSGVVVTAPYFQDFSQVLFRYMTERLYRDIEFYRKDKAAFVAINADPLSLYENKVEHLLDEYECSVLWEGIRYVLKGYGSPIEIRPINVCWASRDDWAQTLYMSIEDFNEMRDDAKALKQTREALERKADDEKKRLERVERERKEQEREREKEEKRKDLGTLVDTVGDNE